jgi:chemotaxis protein MotB
MGEVAPNQPNPAGRKPLPKPPAHPDDLPEAMEWEELAPKRRGGRGALMMAIVGCLLSVGLGYVAWQESSAGQKTLATLTKTTSELHSVSEERTRTAAALADGQKQLAEEKQRNEQDASELADLKAKLFASEARLSELEAQSEALNQHLAEFRALTKQFQRMIDSGKLQIGFRRGRMIVELPAAVLFASGSADLSVDGRQALQDIAKILRKVPGKRFIIGGHTDDVPIAKGAGPFSSNWSLSAARAVMVTESLISAGLRADHLVAAGYGEYDPITSNSNDKGRQKNRRIEIVLEPELAGLPNALADLKKESDASKPAAKAAAKK